MKAALQTVRFLSCPNCGERMSSIDHLEIGREFGPWNCPNLGCNTRIVGSMQINGPDIEVRPKDRAPTFVLLKFRDLYLVVDEPIGTENPDYFYHSHQCPQNILGHLEGVFSEKGCDPHGTIRFVAQIPWSEKMKKWLDEVDSLEELFLLFKTDGTPPPTEWPEENGGVM